MRAPGDGLDTEYAFVVRVLRVKNALSQIKHKKSNFNNQVNYLLNRNVTTV